MNTMNKTPFRLAAVAALTAGLISTGSVAAPGYATDTAATTVLSGFGECVQTGFWDSTMSTPECDAELAARLEAERLEAERLAAAEAAAAAAAAAAIKPAAAKLITVSDSGNVAFDFDSANLTSSAVGELDRVSAEVAKYSRIDRIEIRGYTDSTGPEEYNQGLSERRAQSVSEALSRAGLPADRMVVEGMGEANPVADNATREGRAQNRRVDVHIVGQRAQ